LVNHLTGSLSIAQRSSEIVLTADFSLKKPLS
jgi:hypothetical protein